jgi:hypothetical protein
MSIYLDKIVDLVVEVIIPLMRGNASNRTSEL